MNIILKLFPVYIFMILGLSACNSSPDELSQQQKRSIENFEFSDWNGNSITVTDFRGKVVILDFWETWCGPCLSAFTVFNRVQNEFPDEIIFIAATAGFQDTADDVRRFIEETDYPFLFVDGSGLSDDLNISGIPYKVIINRDGEVEHAQVGFRGHEGEYETLVGYIENM